MLDLARRAVRWRVPARWWLFAVGSPAVLAGAAVLVMAIGPGAPELGGFRRMAALPGWGVLFVWLVFVVVNGLGEETGWRGYALPLRRRRHGTLAASLLLVPIWAGWHLPLLFLLQSNRDRPWPRWGHLPPGLLPVGGTQCMVFAAQRPSAEAWSCAKSPGVC